MIASINPKVIIESNKVSMKCFIVNATSHEKELFSKALGEMYSLSSNSRFIIKRKVGAHFYNKIEYYAIPRCIARNKKALNIFKSDLSQVLGKHQIINGRSKNGRNEYIKARYVYSQFTDDFLDYSKDWKSNW
jgi:hypothetical protein